MSEVLQCELFVVVFLVSKTEESALDCIHGASHASGLGTHFPETSCSAQSCFLCCSYSPCYLCTHRKNVGAPRWEKPQHPVPRDPKESLWTTGWTPVPTSLGLLRLHLCSLVVTLPAVSRTRWPLYTGVTQEQTGTLDPNKSCTHEGLLGLWAQPFPSL